MNTQHTFGGTPLDRYTFEFEVPDPSGAGDPGLGPDPVEPDAPAEPAWSMSEEQYNELAQAVGFLTEQHQRQQAMFAPQPQQQEQAPSFYDDPDGWLDHRLGQRLAPLQQFREEIQLQEGHEQALDILSNLASTGGDFNQEIAMLRAEQLLPQMKQQFGDTWQAAEKALEAAAEQQRAYEQQVREQAVAQHTNHLATLSGAAHEPGATYTVGTQQRTVPDYTKGGSVTQRFFGPNAES